MFIVSLNLNGSRVRNLEKQLIGLTEFNETNCNS